MMNWWVDFFLGVVDGYLSTAAVAAQDHDVFQEVESGAKVISKELLMTESQIFKKQRHWNQTLRLP